MTPGEERARSLLGGGAAPTTTTETPTEPPTTPLQQESDGAARARSLLDDKTRKTLENQNKGDSSFGTAFKQGVVEGGSGLLGLPGLINKGISKLTGQPTASWEPTSTPADWEASAAKNNLYNPDWQPKTWSDYMGRALGYGTAAVPLAIGAGLAAPEETALGTIGTLGGWTFGPELAGGAVEKLTGLPSWITSMATGFGGPALARLGLDLNEYRKAGPAAEKAANALKEFQGTGELDASKAAAEKFKDQGPDYRTSQANLRADIASEAQRHTDRLLQDAATKKQGLYDAAEDAHMKEGWASEADREAAAKAVGGTSYDQATAAPKVQQHFRNWVNGVDENGVPVPGSFPEKAKAIEHGMYEKLPDDTPMKLTNFTSTLKNGWQDAGELEGLMKTLRGKLPAQMESALDKVVAGQGGSVGDAPDTLLRNVKILRSGIGDALGTPGTVNGLDRAKLAELYKSLSSDIEAGAAKVGPEALKAFKDYNGQMTDLYSKVGLTSKAISTKNAGQETLGSADVIKNLLEGTDKAGDQLAKLRTEPELAKGLNEFASAKIRSDPEGWKALHPDVQTALAGPGKATQVQAAIDRQKNADEALIKAKTAADENYKTESEVAKTSGENYKGAMESVNRNTTIANRMQEGRAVVTRKNAAVAKNKELTQAADATAENAKTYRDRYSGSGFFSNIPLWNWVSGGLGAVGSWGNNPERLAHAMQLGGGSSIGTIANHLLPWAGLGLTAGTQEAIMHPRSVRNALLQTPSALGKIPGSTP